MERDLSMSEPDEVLDVTGEMCPYPQLYTKEKLAKMSEGSILQVITDHPPAGEETIPTYCHQKGYPFHIEKKGATFYIKIRKIDS